MSLFLNCESLVMYATAQVAPLSFAFSKGTDHGLLASALAIDSAVQITDTSAATWPSRAARAKYTNMVLVGAAAQTTDTRIASSVNTGLDFNMVLSCCRTRNPEIVLIGSTDYRHQHELRQPPRPPTSTWPRTVCFPCYHRGPCSCP